jgi:hypothetical protein
MVQASLRGQFSQFSGVGGIGSGSNYPDPFLDIASTAIPTNYRSALYWSEYIFNTFGTYRMAMERVISYFLTDVEVSKASDDETEKWTDFLSGDTLDVRQIIQSKLRNRECYGNDFSSIIRPFIRFLACPKCGYMAPLREVSNNRVFGFKYKQAEPEQAFHATCPVCKTGAGYNGPWRIKDEDDDIEREAEGQDLEPARDRDPPRHVHRRRGLPVAHPRGLQAAGPQGAPVPPGARPQGGAAGDPPTSSTASTRTPSST